MYAYRLTDFKPWRSVIALARGRLIVSTETFELVYDGPRLADHQIDIRCLVPALQGLGELIREGNHILNQDQAEVLVLVNSDHKKGCFSVSIDVLQQFQEAAGAVLAINGIKTAKDILEWLDLFGISAAGLFSYLKWRAGREVVSVQRITDTNGAGSIAVQVKGDGNTTHINNTFVMPPETWKLATDPKIAKAVRDLTTPLRAEGIESVFTRKNHQETLLLTKPALTDLEASCVAIMEDQTILSTNTVIAHLRPYDAEFNEKAKSWGFWHGDKHVPVDISDTDIAKEAVERRAVSMDDIYKVDLQITERRTPGGTIKVDYKIVKLHERFPGPRQDDLFGSTGA